MGVAMNLAMLERRAKTFLSFAMGDPVEPAAGARPMSDSDFLAEGLTMNR
jgi:hypothetical protein